MLAVNPEAIQRLRHKIKPNSFAIATNDELAQCLGVSPATISRILAGKAQPGVAFLEGILRYLGYDWFREIIKVVD